MSPIKEKAQSVKWWSPNTYRKILLQKPVTHVIIWPPREKLNNHTNDNPLLHKLRTDHLCLGLPMEPYSYTQEDIAKTVVAFIHRSLKEPSHIQQKAIIHLQEALDSLERNENDMPLNYKNTEDIRNMEFLYNVFDDLFFNKLLSATRNISFHKNLPSKPLVIGLTTTFHEPKWPYFRSYSKIKLRISKEKDPIHRMKEYITVLLHEMIHAVLGIYNCQCVPFCDAKNLSTSHHGVPFLDIAQACVDVISRACGYKVCIFGESDVVGDCLSGWGIIPDNATLQKYNLNTANIWRDVCKEWYTDNVQPKLPRYAAPYYEEWVLTVLKGIRLYEGTQNKDLLITLIREIPKLTPAVMKEIAALCFYSATLDMALHTLRFLIIAKPTPMANQLALEFIEQIWNIDREETDEGIRPKISEVIFKYTPDLKKRLEAQEEEKRRSNMAGSLVEEMHLLGTDMELDTCVSLEFDTAQSTVGTICGATARSLV